MDAEKPKEIVEDVVHEVEHIVEEVERGETEATPLFLGLGLMVVLGIIAAILMAIAFLVYALAS
jgi:hypothetical protein